MICNALLKKQKYISQKTLYGEKNFAELYSTLREVKTYGQDEDYLIFSINQLSYTP